jgi:hypothetical protein
MSRTAAFRAYGVKPTNVYNSLSAVSADKKTVVVTLLQRDFRGRAGSMTYELRNFGNWFQGPGTNNLFKHLVFAVANCGGPSASWWSSPNGMPWVANAQRAFRVQTSSCASRTSTRRPVRSRSFRWRRARSRRHRRHRNFFGSTRDGYSEIRLQRANHPIFQPWVGDHPCRGGLRFPRKQLGAGSGA